MVIACLTRNGIIAYIYEIVFLSHQILLMFNEKQVMIAYYLNVDIVT